MSQPQPTARHPSPWLRRARLLALVVLFSWLGSIYLGRASSPLHVGWHPTIRADAPDEQFLVKVGSDRLLVARAGTQSPVQILAAPGSDAEVSGVTAADWNALASPAVFFDAPKYLSSRPRRIFTWRLWRASGAVIAQIAPSPDGTKIAVLSTTREYNAPTGGLLILPYPSIDGPEGWPKDFYVDILSKNGWFRASGPWRLDGTSGPVGAPEIRWLSDQSGLLAFHADRGTWWIPTPSMRLTTPSTPK